MDVSAFPAPFSVHVRSARVVFDGETLFDDLDFSLEGGRWTCLLGASGVGKSTLLRTIVGLETDGGNRGDTVCSDGRPLTGRAAMMAQRDLLFPWLTVLENVMLGNRLRGRSRDGRARALALIAEVGLATYAHARPAALSGGMRQRVALARTLMEDRPVVLMDEPFSGLDAVTKVRLQDMAAGMLAGRTVLLVTHDPLEALRLGHRILILAGRPARLIEDFEPAGALPRDVADPEVLRMQGRLLHRLAEAQA
jgi:putative hydroxymethylpyrimidine transport system ATP-binding protein